MQVSCRHAQSWLAANFTCIQPSWLRLAARKRRLGISKSCQVDWPILFFSERKMRQQLLQLRRCLILRHTTLKFLLSASKSIFRLSSLGELFRLPDQPRFESLVPHLAWSYQALQWWDFLLTLIPLSPDILRTMYSRCLYASHSSALLAWRHLHPTFCSLLR